MRPTSRIASIEALFDAAAASALAVALVVALTGSVELSVHEITFRARGAIRPLTIGLVSLLARLALTWSASTGARSRMTAAALFRVTCLTVLATDLGIVLAWLVTSCGGLDSAGYLGAARLFLTGHVTELQPIARILPFGNPTAAAAPLGFVPAAQAFYIAPRFPPGLPLVMALVTALGGEAAPFYVAPIMGFAMLPLVYAIARRAAGPDIAALAAVLVGTNAVFLGMALQPMSDIPATFWVVLAAFFLWRPAPSPVRGGLAIGMALLTRPPLALVALALGVTTEWSDRRQPVVFAAVTAAVGLALILFQWHVYGHPFTSGYGTAGQLFTPAALAWNSVHYTKWLLVVLTPLAVIAGIAGACFAPRMAWRAAAVFAATTAPYLVYAPRFEDWEVLRFLLPGLPAALIVCAAGVSLLVGGRSHRPRMFVAGACVAIAAAFQSYSFLARQHLPELWQQELRYPLVGRWFATNTPANSVALAALHGGSIRYYSGRPTLRLDALPGGALARTLLALQQAGYEPYLVVEQGDEFEAYQRRFPDDPNTSVTMTPETRIRGVYVFRLGVK